MLDYPLMHPPFEIKDFKEMTRKEARVHFNWYVNEIPIRIELLKKAYEFTSNGSETDLDYSPESLIPLWEWFVNDIAEVVNLSKEEIEKKLSETPEWIHSYIKRNKLSVSSQGVALDIGLYLAETLKKNIDSLYWDFKSTSKTYIFCNKPILRHPTVKWYDFEPAHMVFNLLYNLLDGNRDIKALYELYTINQKYFI
ncbi:hypothetical protein J45TS6_36270 [Paenibacillus sp. J45TS6]|nr:hypothetical protein J45TS6_36270 [Paenibacillus sp. J45TS6]